MSVPGAIVSFLLLWWLCLFVVLPMRPRSIWQEPDKHVKGADQGAPVDPAMWWRLKWTTIITIPVWGVVMLIISSGVFDPSRG